MHWMENTHIKIKPIDPNHKPTNENALGSANIPAPMFPFITCDIVWSMLWYWNKNYFEVNEVKKLTLGLK